MIEFLKRKDEEKPGTVFKISEVAIFSRIDLLEIIYRETNVLVANVDFLDNAAGYGKLEVVKYLTESGASCSVNVLDYAAMNGHLEIVKFLHFNRSEGCDMVLVNASYYGHFEVVKYLVENADLEFLNLKLTVPIEYTIKNSVIKVCNLEIPLHIRNHVQFSWINKSERTKFTLLELIN